MIRASLKTYLNISMSIQIFTLMRKMTENSGMIYPNILELIFLKQW